MKMCPVCNSFQKLQKDCPFCQDRLVDGGRVADFLDPYGHYNDIETSNIGDGYDIQNKQCSHLLYCEDCNYDEVFMIAEQPL